MAQPHWAARIKIGENSIVNNALKDLDIWLRGQDLNL